MAKVQRNDPCPCGSGKKYKQCCLKKESGAAGSRANCRRGVQLALGWINKTYPEQIGSWVDNVWLDGLSKEQRDEIGTADPGIRSLHDVNLLEYLVAEGTLDEVDETKSALQLILEADIALDDEQRAYLSQLADRPLRLYRVSDVETNRSFSVTLHPDDGSEPTTIMDSSASTMFEVDDYVALRLIQNGEQWETSGAAYHFPIQYVETLLGMLEKAGEERYSKALVLFWLQLVALHV